MRSRAYSFFVCLLVACSQDPRYIFWLITNALRSWKANVFMEWQLMLSDKCLNLSQGSCSSCPSFRLCQTSPLVEADNNYTGGDWKGWPCQMRLESGGKKISHVFIETLKILTFAFYPSWVQMKSAFPLLALSAWLLQFLPTHLVPRCFCTGTKQKISPTSKTKHF